jgi:hypothetical protein
MGLEDWLLFLGAGASAPDPCNLPPFGALSDAILGSIGWTSADQLPGDEQTVKRWRFAEQPYYPDIARLDTAAEVLFGTLRTFGVKFESEVCDTFRDACPNAVHEVAAHVLRTNGCVWTTNIDVTVERACHAIGLRPHRTGRQMPRRKSPLHPLTSTRAGSYVKFHGTVEAPRSLAFTDRQLTAPLPTTDLNQLATLAGGRIAVFYGYFGADADLADLLDRILSDAAEVHWFEPTRLHQALISQAFPKSKDRIQFVPDWKEEPHVPDPLQVVGRMFLELARAAGRLPDQRLSQLLIEGRNPPRKLVRGLKTPSGATQAQLVERFGESASDDDKSAWDKAWAYDLRNVRVGSLRQHLRHRINYSLYHDGRVAKITRWLADHRKVLGSMRPRAFQNYFITRACALYARTATRDRDRLGSFVNWAVNLRKDSHGRPFPSDTYYKAQVQRYALEPAKARSTAEEAAQGLVRITDLQRLAGALYEAGDAALYQADFNGARAYAFDLRFRRGRYAIARWQAWGAWLEIMARAHLRDVGPDLDSTIKAMQARFDFEQGALNRADGRTAELLVARVRLALNGSLELDSLEHPTDDLRPRRYRDDLDLLLADIAIAQNKLDEARRRLERVCQESAILVSALWATIGLAELKRLSEPNYQHVAAEMFWEVAEQAHARGAAWLEAQALLGVQLCQDPRADSGWQRLTYIWPRSGGVSLDEIRATPATPPRVLWMVTL